MDITEFLRARLDDDEAYARMAFADHNEAGPEWSEPWNGGVLTGGRGGEVVDTFDSGLSSHMARHDPARALREVEAKRAVLDMALSEQDASGRYGAGFNESREGWNDAQDYVLKQLAAVYADHPDHRQEWAL